MGDAIPVVRAANHAGQPPPPERQAGQADGAKHLQRQILLRGEHAQVSKLWSLFLACLRLADIIDLFVRI